MKLKKILGLLKSKKQFITIRNFWSLFKSSFKSSNFFVNKNRNQININKKNILICTFSGDNFLIKMIDILFYHYFKYLGHNIYILKCNKSLSLCALSDYSRFKVNKSFFQSQNQICKYCNVGFQTDFKNNFYDKICLSNFIEDFNNDHINSKNILNKLKIDIENFEEIVESASLRFLGKSYLQKDNNYEKKVYLEYYNSSQKFLFGFLKVIDNNNIDLILDHQGIYSPHGIISLIANQKKIPYYSWTQGYRKRSIIITKNSNIHKFFANLNNWSNFEFTTKSKNKINRYLDDRITGKNDWVKFQSNTKNEADKPFDNDNPTFFLPLNVSWDAQLHFPKNIFKDIEDFLFFTLDFFIKNKNKNLLIRGHPGELLSQVPSNEFIIDIIKRKYLSLPKNIKVISSYDNINSFSLAKLSDVAIVYASKMSIELAAKGMPVICCGEAWIKSKGITFDPISKNEYEDLLNSDVEWLKDLAKNKKNLALKFAYYYFFRKTVEISSIKKNLLPKYIANISNITNDKNLKIVANKILNNEEVELD
jgi:hypothetical protein